MAIIISDVHLRADTPEARLDSSYWDTQLHKWETVVKAAQDSPPLIVCGDLLDKPQAPHTVVAMIIRTLRRYQVPVLVTPGQHDLPEHRVAKWHMGALGPLVEAGVLEVVTEDWRWIDDLGAWMYFCPFGCEPPIVMRDPKELAILIWHRMVISQKLWPGQRDPEAHAVVRKYGPNGAGFDFIFTGDNHRTVEAAGVLYNSGSMLRMEADQQGHIPRYYKIDRDEDDYLKVRYTRLPIQYADEVLTDAHLERKRKLEQMTQAVLREINEGERLQVQDNDGNGNGDGSAESSIQAFLDLLKSEMLSRKVPQPDVDLLWECYNLALAKEPSQQTAQTTVKGG